MFLQHFYLKPYSVFIALHCFHPHCKRVSYSQRSGGEELNADAWVYGVLTPPSAFCWSRPWLCALFSDAGGTATAAVTQSDEFLHEKGGEKSLCNVLSGLDPTSNRSSFGDGLALLVLCTGMSTARFVFIVWGNCSMNEARCARLCSKTSSCFVRNLSQKPWKRHIKTLMEFILGNYR